MGLGWSGVVALTFSSFRSGCGSAIGSRLDAFLARAGRATRARPGAVGARRSPAPTVTGRGRGARPEAARGAQAKPSTERVRTSAAPNPCGPAGVRYASKRGGSRWQIHAPNPNERMERNHAPSPAEPTTRPGAFPPRVPSPGVAGRWPCCTPAISGRVTHDQPLARAGGLVVHEAVPNRDRMATPEARRARHDGVPAPAGKFVTPWCSPARIGRAAGPGPQSESSARRGGRCAAMRVRYAHGIIVFRLDTC